MRSETTRFCNLCPMKGVDVAKTDRFASEPTVGVGCSRAGIGASLEVRTT